VVVAGGGIAGAEALLALHELGGDLLSLTLVEPRAELRLAPLEPAAVFGTGDAGRLQIADVAGTAGADVVRDALDSVDADRRTVRTRAGEHIRYDALVVATGSRAVAGVPGALTWSPGGGAHEFTTLLADLNEGRVRRLAFVVPSRCAWPLPAYELALMTARRLARQGVRADLRLITPEAAPLAVFGAAGSAAVARELDDAGVVFSGDVVPSVDTNAEPVISTWPTLQRFTVDRVVVLSHSYGREIAGLPADLDGLLVVDEHCAVRGVPSVWAAGEATDRRPMPGGLAARQADCAAQEIARQAGAAVPSGWYTPLLRAQLRTGRGSIWLQRDISDPLDAGCASRVPLWSPPGKIAARRLGALLAAHDEPGGLRLAATTEDR
jgi:sulfide:quinone oxidoreductase